MKMKKIHTGILSRPLKFKTDYYYYWQNGKLFYYGEYPGTGRTIECKDIESLEQLLTFRENEQAIENQENRTH